VASTLRVGAPCAVAALALLVASAPATAAPKRITGKLSKPGYSVIAVAADGKGKVSAAKRRSRRFSLRPPAKLVTLHLRGRNGGYAGPIVLGTSKRGARAIVGVKAGTRLGLVRVDSRKRYGAVQGLAQRRVDRSRWARAKNGVPIGAGQFGLVRSRIARRRTPPGDLDADGVADPLDIDNNGNLVLDRYEASRATSSRDRATAAAAGIKYYLVVLAVNADRSVQVRTCDSNSETTARWPADEPLPEVGKSYQVEVDEPDISQAKVLSVGGPLDQGCPAIAFVPSVAPGLFLTLGATVNANAATVGFDQLNDTLARRGFLWLGAGLRPDVRVELDCGGSPAPGGWSGGLSYCRKGGTGRAFPGIITDTPPRSWPIAFPDAADTNGNGFGEPAQLTGPARRCNAPCVDALLSHGATTQQIGTGDVLNWRITKGGVETQFPTTLPDVYATVPALVFYRDGAGNSATVSYPLQQPFVGSPKDYFGESQGPYQGFPVAPCPAGAPSPCIEGDVVVTLEFWRPQRRAIPGAEEGEWTDIGGLVYTPGVALANAAALPHCTAGEVSTADPNLTPATANVGGLSSGAAGFRDAALDRRADPGKTLSFSVNLTKCYPHMFAAQPDPTWDPGESRDVWLVASAGGNGNGGGNFAIQALKFTMK
jgi:hypothetical protein